MTYLTDQERTLLLNLIDGRIAMISGRSGAITYRELVMLRHKLEGTDKRIKVEKLE